MKFTNWNMVIFILTIIGAINWGIIGLFDFNIIDSIFSNFYSINKIIYSLIGFAGLFSISLLIKIKESV